MKLEKMFRNVLSFSLEELMVKVEADSQRRRVAIAEAMSKVDAAPKKRSGAKSESAISTEEKALLKSLGLSAKAIRSLVENANG